jgi:protein gp37
MSTDELKQIVRDGFYDFIRVGLALRTIRDERRFEEEGYATFQEFCVAEFHCERAYAYRQIAAAEVGERLAMSPIGDIALTEFLIRPLTRIKNSEDQLGIWRNLNKLSDGEELKLTAKIVAAAVREFQIGQRSNPAPSPKPPPDFKLKAALPVLRVEPPALANRGLWIPEPAELEYLRQTSTTTFNKQNTDSIEWARWSWNPVTGCLHGCFYCYARAISTSDKMAEVYPQKFEPTFIPERLGAPRNTKVPPNAKTEIGWKNVFVCSMADLWGKWMPREIIEAVLREVDEYPQWNYLFLTKFPDRYLEFDFPAHTWLGTSVDTQAAVERAETSFSKLVRKGHKGVRWLSVEPMLEPVKFSKLSMFDWVVIGGMSCNEQCKAFYPPMRWVLDLMKQADKAGCKIYLKPNWYADESRLREYPEGERA